MLGDGPVGWISELGSFAWFQSVLSVAMKRRTKFILTGIALVVALGAALFGAFRFSSVCGHCGLLRQTTRWQVPCVELTLWETHAVSRNDFSDFAGRHGRTADQPHQWLFATGGGNCITCAIGAGRYLWPTIHHSDTRRLLELCFQVDEKLAGLLLDAKRGWQRLVAGCHASEVLQRPSPQLTRLAATYPNVR